MLIASGAEPRTIMGLMGHSSVAITYNLYGHLFPGTHDRAGQQLQAYLDAATRSDRMADPNATTALS